MIIISKLFIWISNYIYSHLTTCIQNLFLWFLYISLTLLKKQQHIILFAFGRLVLYMKKMRLRKRWRWLHNGIRTEGLSTTDGLTPNLTLPIQNLFPAKHPLSYPILAINLNSTGCVFNLKFSLFSYLYKDDIFMKCLLSLCFYIFKYILFPF